MKQITIITGPTASGKTAFALNYSKQFKKAIIINADASAVYKDFTILTAQPSLKDRQLLPHFLFEICDIVEDFSVNKWLLMCNDILRNPEFEGVHKIIVGGTCMYIFLLINGLISSPQISNDIRLEALELYNKIGHEEFLKMVSSKDGETKTDKQRLINNYSLILQTGKSFNEWQNEPKKMFLQSDEFDIIKITPSREEVYANCNNRFLKMFEMGAEMEVKNALIRLGSNYIFKKILCADEIKDYINGKISKEKMIELAMQKTRNLAKSQFTWLNNKL